MHGDGQERFARGVVRRLVEAGESLPPDVERRIAELGAAVVPALLEVLEDPELADERGPGDGSGPIHAARLLGELRVAEAVEPMLRVLATGEGDSWLEDEIAQA